MSSVSALPFVRAGTGKVPASPLVGAAWKALIEGPILESTGASALGLGSQLDFSTAGVTMDRFREFFTAAEAAAKKKEAIVEAGNKYSVSKDFMRLNGELLLYEIENSTAYTALSQRDQVRATEFFSFMCLNGDLRNRNPLHPNHLDSAVIGNLVNFPKHLFGFPFAGYSTNGSEALSLLLFSYRSECKKSNPHVLYVVPKDEEEPSSDIQGCISRLGLQLHVVTGAGPIDDKYVSQGAVVMTSFTNPALTWLSEWAASVGLAVHVHVSDIQIRGIFADNAEPIHFDVPAGVRSMSLSDGLFKCGYQLYRDTRLRDVHVDLPYVWDSAYMSPNEGGSGNSTPLYVDFCFMLLGWSALRDITKQTASKAAETLRPMVLAPYGDWTLKGLQGANTVDDMVKWGKASMQLPRDELERNVFQFQRNFVGGKTRYVEALVSGGGTRSANYAFQSVLVRAKAVLGPGSPVKLICGNPHILVERAERRFQFNVVRVPKDGIICIDSLKREIRDPTVALVYAQTLSISDGITDPLVEVLAVLEEENKKRKLINGLPVTLINDCCLAFSVLIHNDGQNGSNNLRVLDLTEHSITPAIVMLDAHKHIGADKGLSMAMGTPGTLSLLSGHVKVGEQPSNGALVRAMSSMALVGVDGYYEKYRHLGAAVAETTQAISSAGMTLINSHNRVFGSTAFGVEDPSACLQKKLKKKGHGPAPLFGIAPQHPNRCQSGFLFHLTPHALRTLPDGKKAVDVLVTDLVEAHKAVKKNYSPLAKLFHESSLPAFLLSGGNEELWLFNLLRKPGFGRDVTMLLLRRLVSGSLDGGVICSNRHQAPLQDLLKRFAAIAVLFLLALLKFRRRV